MKRLLLVLGIGAALGGCDRRPIEAVLALPRPGEELPQFSFPVVGRGELVTAQALRGRPAVIALWRTTCYASREAVASLVAIHREYAPKGVRVVILSADDDSLRLRAYVDSTHLQVPVAYAGSKRVRQLFDRSRAAPERTHHRISMALPSFLVVDAEGRVTVRDAGVSMDTSHRLEAVRAGLRKLVGEKP